MAQNITLLGASYTAVPAVTLPKTGGGTAKFSDASVTTAVASDVAEGKIFLLADGTQATGTASGGGGSVTWETMVDQTCTITTYDGMRIIVINGYDEPLSADETYRITWGDTQYICNTIVDSVGFTQDGYFIGNAGVFGSQYEDTGEPFALYRTSSTRMTGATNDTVSSVYVKIERQSTSSATLITKTITENGTYNASSDGADGYSQVTVNVPSSAVSSWTKVAETTYQVSTTGTSIATVATWATGHSEIWTDSKWVYVRIRDTAGKRAGYFYGSDQLFVVYPTTATSTTLAARFSLRYTSSGDYGATISSYGVYADALYSDGSIRIRKRYHSSNSLTIDGTYKVEVYLLDPAGGVPIFT